MPWVDSAVNDQRLSQMPNPVDMGRDPPTARATRVGPAEVLAMGGCETSAHVHPIKNAQCTGQGSCSDVQTPLPSCSSS